MAQKATADGTAIAAGVHDVACEHGSARIHVPRDISAHEIARAFSSLVAPREQEVIADAA